MQPRALNNILSWLIVMTLIPVSREQTWATLCATRAYELGCNSSRDALMAADQHGLTPFHRLDGGIMGLLLCVNGGWWINSRGFKFWGSDRQLFASVRALSEPKPEVLEKAINHLHRKRNTQSAAAPENAEIYRAFLARCRWSSISGSGGIAAPENAYLPREVFLWWPKDIDL